MFDFSLAELGLIAVVSVIFIGPDELPVVIRHVSKGLRTVRNLSKELRDAFDDLSRESGVQDISKQFENDIRNPIMIKGDDGKMYESYHPVYLSTAPAAPAEKPAPPPEEAT